MLTASPSDTDFTSHIAAAAHSSPKMQETKFYLIPGNLSSAQNYPKQKLRSKVKF